MSYSRVIPLFNRGRIEMITIDPSNPDFISQLTPQPNNILVLSDSGFRPVIAIDASRSWFLHQDLLLIRRAILIPSSSLTPSTILPVDLYTAVTDWEAFGGMIGLDGHFYDLASFRRFDEMSRDELITRLIEMEVDPPSWDQDALLLHRMISGLQVSSTSGRHHQDADREDKWTYSDLKRPVLIQMIGAATEASQSLYHMTGSFDEIEPEEGD